MGYVKLKNILKTSLPEELADDLVRLFLEIRYAYAMNDIGRAAPGKFVERFTQILQQFEQNSYDDKPNVEQFLRNLESRSSKLDDGLRLCAGRICRSLYTLRSKRNIVHVTNFDTSIYDLKYIYASARWLLAELVRIVTGSSMDMAGDIINEINLPIGGYIEDFGDKTLITAKLSTRKELLLILQSKYPNKVTKQYLVNSLDRKNLKTVSKMLNVLWKEKLIEKFMDDSYKLTSMGLSEAVESIRKLSYSE